MPRKLADAHQCLCSQFVVENGHRTTGCSQDTRRTFAPGHDARLVGFLADAGTHRYEVSRYVGGVVHTADALTMARNVLSPELAAKVTAAFDRKNTAEITGTDPGPMWSEEDQVAAQEKAQAAYYQELRRPTPLAEVPKLAKVGRWIYAVDEIDSDGTLFYTTKSGAPKSAAEGTYKLI
jgi:hypothetical protein